MNPLTAARNGIRVPNLAATHPAVGIATALATMKLVQTHVIVSCEASSVERRASSADCICGSATLAIVMSRN